MTLKGVCNALSRKPLALDVVMLFTQPTALLQPLCHILDGWQDHEDQGYSWRTYPSTKLTNIIKANINQYMTSSEAYSCSSFS